MANLRVDKITSTETFETTGSVQFNLNDDNYLSGTITAIGTQDFTIECWVYLLANRSSQHQRFFGNDDGAFDSNTLTMRFTPNLAIQMYYGSNDVTSHTLSESTWYHVAMSYSDNIARCYIDGKEFGTIPGNTDLGNTTMFIGGTYTVGGENFNGHVSNARLIVGKGIYPTNFKPPMRELEVTPETVLLACQSKTDKLEERSGNTTLSATGILHSASELTPGLLTPVPKAGAGSAITGSVEFGESDYLTLASSSDFNLGTEDFTIEFWIHPQKRFTSYPTIFEIDATDNANRLLINFRNAATLGLTSGTTVFATNAGFDLDEWYHIAVVRESGVSRIYKNGITGGDTACTADFSNSGSSDIFIGWDSTTTSTEKYNGFISNLRVVKGTALYTHDFIPPTRELKKVPGTVLLCCQDPDSPLTEATGKTITGYGSLQRADGVELITNGTFNSDVSNWTATNCTLTYSSGQMQVTRTSGTGITANQAFTTVAGNKYNISGTINSSGSRGDLRVFNGSGTGGSLIVSLSGTNGAVTDLKGTFIASSTTSTVAIAVDDNSTSVIVDNISVTLAEGSNRGSNFTPQVGDDRKVTFEGVTKVNSDAYFYLPTGDTTSRETTGTYSAGTRGIFGGGFIGPGASDHRDRIQYINIASTGNAIDAGDLTVSRYGNAALASATRAVWAGGIVPTPAIYNTIDAVEIMSTGNAFDFGDLYNTVYYPAGFSNRTRGIYTGGAQPILQNDIGYITISSKGNSVDFGNLITARNAHATFSSPTRGVIAGGWISPVRTNAMEYVTIASTGNGQDFGDLTRAQNYAGGCSSAIRGLTAGGNAGNPSTVVNTIDYVTIPAMGNAADFGDLTTARAEVGACSSSTRGVFAGSWSPAKTNVMDYVTIQTTANAKDFGDLVDVGVMQEMGTSNGHGGLG